MASSTKASSSKKSSSNRVYGVAPLPPASFSPDREDEVAINAVMVYNAVRAVGDTPPDKSALFLPASAEECSVLVNNFRRHPNSAPPAFHLARYAKPERLDFRNVVAALGTSPAPATFYPSRYARTCSVFAEGRASTSEGLHLYQALVILQKAFSKIIGGHHSKAENGRRILQLTNHPNFSECLRYYHEHWHYTNNCPLFAPLLIALVCDFCEEHLSPAEYKKRVYDSKARKGLGISAKTRERVKACVEELPTLKTLAIPIPFNPNTREGQIIVTVASKGTEVDQIRQPYTNIALRPDPSKRVSTPKPDRSDQSSRSTKVPAVPPRPITPEEEEDLESDGSSFHGASARPSPARFPVPSSPAAVDDNEEEVEDSFSPVPELPVASQRQSIARAAKSKPLVPEVIMKAPGPAPKRSRASPAEDQDPPFREPPSKKRRTAPKARAATPASQELPGPTRIQEGEPDYFDDDDIKTSGHQHFLTNPDFKPKAPFSQLIRKTIAQNPRAPKLPFLRRPKWQISEEMKDFGAFINSADTSFSLQGLSRYNYLTSRPLQASSSNTLPSPEALLSPNNCLTCLSRGVVCEGGTKIGGPCGHCDRTHRNCPSCLGLDEHRDRFLAIHNTVQGYPAGYSGSLDRFRNTLDEMRNVASSFGTIFGDVRRRLALNLQEIHSNGFDFNVVLSKWVEDNPNHPLDYDLLTWLATFFGWDSACNLSSYLVDPTDSARLEEFLRSNELPTTEATEPGALEPIVPSSSVPQLHHDSPVSPAKSAIHVPASPLTSRRRPLAAVPDNFHQDHKFHTPLPESITVDDEELDGEEGTSRTSVGRTLLAERDDSDEDDDLDVEIINDDTSGLSKPKKPPTLARSLVYT
ncbi:hypothetical protein FB446DRAFT_709989 [Lentinula raphanica]|nr:hypothetical protein FB446DRAFT_709989 [Lentinula raphanica]